MIHTIDAQPSSFIFGVLPNVVCHQLFDALWPSDGRRRYLPPTALVEFACTCKAAAAIALPALYSNLQLTSLLTPPKVFAVLASPVSSSSFSATLNLRSHVRSITVSPHFVCEDQFHLLAQAVQSGCKLDETSWIMSTRLVNQRLTRETLNQLPMSWLMRLATFCPHLVSVDLSNVGNLGRARPIFLYGFQALADILRARGGRFTSTATMPVSAVLVSDNKTCGSEFVQDVYFVTRVDWGRKEIDVGNDLAPHEISFRPENAVWTASGLCLIPFADLVGHGGNIQEQERWAIRNVTIRVPDLAWLALFPELTNKAKQWLSSPVQLYKRSGIRRGLDRVFELCPATIKGTITIATPQVDAMCGMVRGHGLDPEMHVAGLELQGLPSLRTHVMSQTEPATSSSRASSGWPT